MSDKQKKVTTGRDRNSSGSQHTVDVSGLSKPNKTEKRETLSRRKFVGLTASAVSAFTIVPRHVLGGPGITAPSDKITAGIIGVGGQGLNDMQRLLQFDEVQVVSVSDPVKKWDYSAWWYGGYAGHEPAKEMVDAHYAENKASGKYKGCNAYFDFREMLEKEDVDAVLVAATDHIHAVASMAALKKGKHVYCEKPLTHTVYEARKLAEAAREAGVATQMGNAGQAGERPRRLSEMLQDGAIGQVNEVHRWTNRPVWPQGMDRPEDTPDIPEGLDWEHWIGPAPMRPYHPRYVAVWWRGWVDFGTGALGDMGCHNFDPIMKALKLGHPTTVEASFGQPMTAGHKQLDLSESWPVASVVRYEFPARDGLSPVTLTWYDGGIKPPRPAEYEDGREWRREGAIYVGDRGTMVNGRLIPESKMKSYSPPPKSLPRSPGHYEEWINAIKGGEPAGSNFDIASLVTQVVLLGNIALRTGKKLIWDGPNMRIVNDPEANALLHKKYREGWSL